MIQWSSTIGCCGWIPPILLICRVTLPTCSEVDWSQQSKCMNLPHRRMVKTMVFLYQSFLKNRHTELKWLCLKILGTAQTPVVLSSSLFEKMRFLGGPPSSIRPKICSRAMPNRHPTSVTSNGTGRSCEARDSEDQYGQPWAVKHQLLEKNVYTHAICIIYIEYVYIYIYIYLNIVSLKLGVSGVC